MPISVNGEARTLPDGPLDALLSQLGYAGAIIATTVNGAFVPATRRQDVCVRDGDAIEIVSPMQGG